MNHLAHFAIHADNVERARRFYEAVFGWTFNAYGQPGFYQVSTGTHTEAPMGAIQERYPLPQGEVMRGFECTISVPDVDETLAKVVAQGGTLVLEKCVIPGVGWLFKFTDTEGNLVVAMEYNPRAE